MEKKIRIIIGKTGIDGHWRGVQSVSTALKNAGVEVIYLGATTAQTISKAALEEDVDVIGLNIGASYEQVEKLMTIIKENKIDNILVVVGGTIPRTDIQLLKNMGVNGVFPPGSKLSDIVQFIKSNVERK